MNIFDIRDTLNAHKEHFRVLPVKVNAELNAIIEAVNKQEPAFQALPGDRKQQVKSVIKRDTKSVVGKRAKKTAKKSTRSKR